MVEEQAKTEDVSENLNDLVGHVTDFVETYYRYAGVSIAQKGINVGSSIINSLVFAFLGLLVVSFAGFGLAWWLGDLLKSRAGGFALVAGFFLLVLLVMVWMRKTLIFPFLRNFLTRKIYE
jgi:Putative Actinobacterial Holin-X, holin superfamily III